MAMSGPFEWTRNGREAGPLSLLQPTGVNRETARRGDIWRLLAMSTLVAACGGDKPKSYDLAAMDASYSGDLKTAITLARKEVARFSTPEQCSPAKNINCGTLALAYGSLAQYQIAAGDRAAGEISFGNARDAMRLMDPVHLPATAGAVYQRRLRSLLEDRRQGARAKR